MRFSPVIAALLCFTTWMSMVHASIGPMASCCYWRSKTRVPLERIVDYTNQSEGLCPITAVVFLTKRGRRICSDPNSDWAGKAIRKVDKEKEIKALQKMGGIKGSTSNITPAVSNTATNAPQKEC
ncbi:C-C motif chemokine 8 isoform X2 [Etheostoma spectabile]|uniref:C-C motif chemokine 8 isoform X2 n=1 Tax=Etheostoma spectabile TaxID=54343 RepID=UPI0013AF25FA|nr:C-C motif chemokine 8-like isoform X2 [Etheostoma spectabile]